MKLDLRPRCQRENCNILIRKTQLAQRNYKLYKPYCSFHCQEWDKLEQMRKYLDKQKEEDNEHSHIRSGGNSSL
jgi:hypothetical protein